MAKIRADMTGNRYGMVVALEPTGRSVKGLKEWRFQCDCGKVFESASAGFRRGTTKSCGCLNIERIRGMASKRASHKLPDNMGAKNKLFGRYKREALGRNLEFNLSKDEFINLTSSNCNYCGSPPMGRIYPKQNDPTSFYDYNGVDRVDSSIGYELTNVVTCCKICNRMKSDMSVDDFLQHLNLIVHNYGSHINVRKQLNPGSEPQLHA